jgi:hypothetical protein
MSHRIGLKLIDRHAKRLSNKARSESGRKLIREESNKLDHQNGGEIKACKRKDQLKSRGS